MKILIDIGHPGHVYLFKNFYHLLVKDGHQVFITVKKRDNIISLLQTFNMKYLLLGSKYDSKILKVPSSILHLARMYSLILSKKINYGVGISGLIPVFSRFSKFKSICFDDDDIAATPLFAKSIANASTILTPSALKNEQRGGNHIAYNGYHELAYLHPNHFPPDASVLEDLGVKENEKYFILRFNAFKAHHDGGEYGLSHDQKQRIIELLLPHGKVFVSSEADSEEFKELRLNIPAHKIHSALYYAYLFVGDSQTMTSETAVLGTPALKCNTFSGRLSIPTELEKKYGLCYSYKPDEFNVLIGKANELLEQKDLNEDWQKRRQTMLADKIDVTAFMVWFIKNYPESMQIMKDDPDYQLKFK